MSAVPAGEGAKPPKVYKVVKTWTNLRPSTNPLRLAFGNHVIPNLSINVPVLDWTKYFVKGKIRVTGLHAASNSLVAVRLYGEAVPGSGSVVTYSNETTDTSPGSANKYHSVWEVEAFHFFTANGTGTASMQVWAETTTTDMSYIGSVSYTLELCWAPDGVPGQLGSKMVRNTSNFNGV